MDLVGSRLRWSESSTGRTFRGERVVAPSHEWAEDVGDVGSVGILGAAVYQRPNERVVIRLVGSLDAAGAVRWLMR